MALTELGGQLRELLQEAGIRLELRLPSQPVEACLDWTLTAALLRELTANAAANAGDGAVTLELSADGPDRIRFTLRNRPCEPLPEALFHRHAAERGERFEGLGLGLSLVSAGAACMGGSFLISTDDSGRVAAVLSLPRRSGEAFTENKWENTIDRVTATANPRQMERVPAGVSFDVEFVINVWDDDDEDDLKELLRKGMNALENDYLGGSGSRGSGQISFEKPWNEAELSDENNWNA